MEDLRETPTQCSYVGRTLDFDVGPGLDGVLVGDIIPVRNSLGRVAEVGGDGVQSVPRDDPVPAHALLRVLSAASLGGRETAEYGSNEECGAHYVNM